MSIVRTDLRETLDQVNARRIRYEPTAPLTATNIQDAITQSTALPKQITTTNVAFAQSPYTVLGTDSYIAVDTSGGIVVINMQAGSARANVPLTIKDITGNADTNAISVVPSGAETVDGLTPYPMDSKYAAVQFIPKAAGGYAVAP